MQNHPSATRPRPKRRFSHESGGTSIATPVKFPSPTDLPERKQI